MPKKIFPPTDDFLSLIKTYYINVMRFRVLTEKEFNELVRKKEVPPKRRFKKGKELGLILKMNGFTIIVWTTFLLQENKFRDADYAWVDVIKNGKLVYPTQRIMRTKNFLERLTRYTLHRYEVVFGTPMCVQCRTFLDIVWPKIKIKKDNTGKVLELKNLGKRFRKCTNPRHKGKRDIVSIDNALSEKSRNFIFSLRKKRAKNKKIAESKGKVYGINRIERYQKRTGKKIV